MYFFSFDRTYFVLPQLIEIILLKNSFHYLDQQKKIYEKKNQVDALGLLQIDWSKNLPID